MDARLAAARAMAVQAARLAANTRCHDVIALDMAGVWPVTDFCILATGTSARQMRTVCDELEQLAKTHGYSIFRRSGYEGDHWIAVDFVDVVVHLFSGEARQYYDLDNLWADAKRLVWDAQPAKS